jgi:SPX domain protein involved in polyphosphate accumulation
MQQQRFELKYLITEDTALLVRDFVRSYLEMDEFSVGRPNYSYPVHSLYLDSDDLKLYWRTINGDKNRFKLRLRYYSTTADSPIFFEIKRRMNNCILKQRGAVRLNAIEPLLRGQLPEPDHLVSKASHHLVAVQRFCHHVGELHARPRVHIAYEREAYVSDNDEVRVTMDRNVCAEPNLAFSVKTQMENPARSFVGEVILELKFTNRFPDWFRELVRAFHVMQCGAAKYVEAVGGIGARRLDATGPVMEEESRLGRSR